jgi:nucleoside-diphosphate-sugar epimerase
LGAIYSNLPDVAAGSAVFLTSAVKILVTGASGFIGRHLVASLAARGEKVVAVSRHQPTSVAGVEWKPTPELSDGTNWAPLLIGCDALVHLAAVAHRRVTDHNSYLAELQRVNVDATVRLYEASRSCGMKRFVFVSSLAAVTSRSAGLIDGTTPAQPSTPYGRSKLNAEQALIELKGKGREGTSLTVLRPPVIYGRGNPGNMDRIFKLIRSGLPLPLESLRNRRSFLYVGNLCDAVHKCLLSPMPIDGTYFVSDRCDLSTPELIRTAAAAMGHPARLLPFPASLWSVVARLQPDGPIAKLVGSLYLDVAPLTRALRWSPPFTPEQGLRATLEI